MYRKLDREIMEQLSVERLRAVLDDYKVEYTDDMSKEQLLDLIDSIPKYMNDKKEH